MTQLLWRQYGINRVGTSSIVSPINSSKDYIQHGPALRGASSRDVAMMEPDAAPAGGVRTPAPGRPRRPARGHYDLLRAGLAGLGLAKSLVPWKRGRRGPVSLASAGGAKPRWSAERRPHPSKEDAARRIRTRLIGAPSPRFLRGAKKVPGESREGRRPTRGRQKHGQI